MLHTELIRAATLDAALYAQVKADATATARALLVVALVALAYGAGGAIRAVAFGRDPPAEAFVVGAQGEVVFWAVGASAVYLLGRHVLGSTATYGQVLRPFAFAGVPGLLILVAALASLFGAQVPVFLVLVCWRLAAGFVAVRQALGLGPGRSAIALLVGVVCGLAAVGVGTATVLEALG